MSACAVSEILVIWLSTKTGCNCNPGDDDGSLAYSIPLWLCEGDDPPHDAAEETCGLPEDAAAIVIRPGVALLLWLLLLLPGGGGVGCKDGESAAGGKLAEDVVAGM